MGHFSLKKKDQKHNRAPTPVFCRGRMTSYLVLFWYLSLRNSSIYSDPSVWGGSFTDEVRPLTAMKQYLKQIKRHFPKLDSCCFQLTQVLHLTTERGGGKRSCIFLGGTKKHGSLGGVCFVLFFCQLPKSPAFSDRHFRFLIDFFFPLTSVPQCSR